MDNRIEVSEEILKEAAIAAGPNSAFHKVLMTGLQVKAEGLTPVYLYDEYLATLTVAIKKIPRHKLN